MDLFVHIKPNAKKMQRFPILNIPQAGISHGLQIVKIAGSLSILNTQYPIPNTILTQINSIILRFVIHHHLNMLFDECRHLQTGKI